MLSGGRVKDVGRTWVRFGSVLFQYNGVFFSVYCHYVVSIMEHVGGM